MNRPFPLILSAPSGAGKTTMARALLERRADVGYSVSCTTRDRRPEEVDGRDYHFLTREAFVEERNAGGFAEWAEVHDRLYGTRRSEVERVLRSGRHCLMDIDVQGARQFSQAFPDSVLVFVLPPSGEALVQRLTGRNSEVPARLRVRMQNALAELQEVGRYQYVIVNDDVEQAVQRLIAIIEAEGARRSRLPHLDDRVAALSADVQRHLSAVFADLGGDST
jgi:guanylate kinase